MTEFSETKKLGEECTLEFRGYMLSEGAAEALNRPVGSYEFYIELRRNGRYVTNTHPSASHQFTKEQYAEIFNAIKSPADFFRTDVNLRVIRKNENTKQIISESGIVAEIVNRYPDSMYLMNRHIHVLEEVIDRLAGC